MGIVPTRIKARLFPWFAKCRSRLTRTMAVVLVSLTCAGLVAIWLYQNREDQDLPVLFLGFVVSWWPTALSVFAFFMPDLTKYHIGWRIGLLLGCLVWSALAWQEKRMQIAADRAESESLRSDVRESNEQMKGQVESLRSDLKGATEHSDSQISVVREDLRGAIEVLSEIVSNTESNLNSTIAGIGKPSPPAPPRLVFSLVAAEAPAEFPLLETPLAPDSDGVFSVEFMVHNSSTTVANGIDMWIDVCGSCIFAKEPSGFSRPDGMREGTRYRRMNTLNAGASSEKMAVDVKVSRTGVRRFAVDMRYTCDTCGGMSEPQKAWLNMLPAPASQ